MKVILLSAINCYREGDIMRKGDPIEIKEIHNGVLINPSISSLIPGRATNDKETIAFQSAEEFIKWISSHFCIYEQPEWNNDTTV